MSLDHGGALHASQVARFNKTSFLLFSRPPKCLRAESLPNACRSLSRARAVSSPNFVFLNTPQTLDEHTYTHTHTTKRKTADAIEQRPRVKLHETNTDTSEQSFSFWMDEPKWVEPERWRGVTKTKWRSHGSSKWLFRLSKGMRTFPSSLFKKTRATWH